jgi:hypothetical protein
MGGRWGQRNGDSVSTVHVKEKRREREIKVKKFARGNIDNETSA